MGSQLYQLDKTKITRFTTSTDEKKNNHGQTTPNSILKNVFDGTKQQQNQNCNITVQKKFKKNQIKFHHHFVTEQIKLMNSQNLYRISVTKLYILSSTFYFTLTTFFSFLLFLEILVSVVQLLF